MRHTATPKGATAIFLFVAELNDFKEGKISEKEAFGITCYLEHTLHTLDHSDKEDRKEVHVNIWLERLYDDLDLYFQLVDKPVSKKAALANGTIAKLLDNPATDHKWTTPVELDASASILQWMGLLLDEQRLLTMTNVIGSELSDPWNFEGIPRTQFKHAATPMLYGSSRACHELWQDKGHKYTIDQVQAFNKELATGALGVANQLKEFIINNVKPLETMLIKLYKDEFEIECNRFRNIGEETMQYDIFDTKDNAIKRITHTNVKQVPDLDQFRRFFPTLLVHGIDGQVANTVIGKVMEKYGWGIDIHDAFIVNAEAAEDTRRWYGEELAAVHANRNQILADFFTSIGIGAEAQGQWLTLKNMIQPTTEFTPSSMALK